MLKQRSTQSGQLESPDYLIGASPFQRSCSLHHFYAGGDRGRVLERVINELQRNNRSVHATTNTIIITGEAGSGKTMLGLVLTQRLKNKFNVVRYDHAQANAEQLIKHLLIEFCPLQTRQLIAQLNHDADQVYERREPEFPDMVSALKESAQIKPVVLLIDSEVIESDSWALLQQLNELRVEGKPAIHTVVMKTTEESEQSSGPSEHSHVRTDDINAVTTQGSVYPLRRLSLAEIHEYLQHQMLLFDFSRRDTFTREMAYFVADRTGGVFRDINTLARSACTLAGVQNHSNVTLHHLFQAGLPEKPAAKKSLTLNALRTGGFRFAIIIASVLATLTTVLLTRL